MKNRARTSRKALKQKRQRRRARTLRRRSTRTRRQRGGMWQPFDPPSGVPAANQGSSATEFMKYNFNNAGLYGQSSNAIPVFPTATNYTHNNLKSANPPPGATAQAGSINRLGNNYSAAPEVAWYSQAGKGPFRIPCISGGGRRRRGRSLRKSRK